MEIIMYWVNLPSDPKVMYDRRYFGPLKDMWPDMKIPVGPGGNVVEVNHTSLRNFMRSVVERTHSLRVNTSNYIAPAAHNDEIRKIYLFFKHITGSVNHFGYAFLHTEDSTLDAIIHNEVEAIRASIDKVIAEINSGNDTMEQRDELKVLLSRFDVIQQHFDTSVTLERDEASRLVDEVTVFDGS